MSAYPSPSALRRALWGLVVVLAATGSACLSGPSDPLDEERERLEQARAQWRSQGLSDYRFTFRRICFCAPSATEPAEVTVRGGVIVSVRSVADGSPVDPQFYFTIEGLFGLLSDAIDAGAAQVRADYDPGRGHPTSGYIDRNEMIADEELGFTATDLQGLR
jgi:hypothetical protein